MNSLEILSNLDAIIAKYRIKYVFVESGKASLDSFYGELGWLDEEGNPNEEGLIEIDPDWHYAVELSWGSGLEDEYDFTFLSFGKTLSGAFESALGTYRMNAKIPGSKAHKHAMQYGIVD
mgnify:CR=1 FL=1